MAKPGYIDIDHLQAETTLEAAAAKCGVNLEFKQSGKEVRIDCPFQCPGDHSGRKELSVDTENPQKVFYCHAYQCQLRGNLLLLMHGWLTGQRPSGDKVRGEDFQRVKRVLTGHAERPIVTPSKPTVPSSPETTARALSIPLQDSDDESIRALATIDEKFITDVAMMSPATAKYIRAHPCLTPESMKKWRVGYLPMDGGGDKRGWSLKGHIVYPMLSEDGRVLAWIGRDPAYEEKKREFQCLIPEERAKRTAPQKHKVPKGFARGEHLFGQHASRLREQGYRERIAEIGIVVVEGFNDVINLDNLGIPAVGLCSNRMTKAQADKIDRYARQLADGKVLLLFDCDGPGDEGAKEALWMLAQKRLHVRLGWTQQMHNSAYRPYQAEQLTEDAVRQAFR